MKRRGARGLVLPGVLALVVLAAGMASGDEVGHWQMDEPRGSGTIADSSGHGHNGTVGDEVTTGVSLPGGGIGFEFHGPFSGYDPERLALVPDSPELDPGTQPYAVTLRIRTTGSRPNIIQKGQNNQRGGFWKFVIHSGWLRCHFRDENGNSTAIGFVRTSVSNKVNDNEWHVIRCERTANGVRATVNYGEPNEVTKFHRGPLGNIDNSRPLMIGGKLDCKPGRTLPKNGREVNCDYFTGLIDWITIEKEGVGAPVADAPEDDPVETEPPESTDPPQEDPVEADPPKADPPRDAPKCVVQRSGRLRWCRH